MPELHTSDGQSIYYRLIPSKNNDHQPYLVFLHEGLGCDALWKGFPGLLCETTGCPGIVYDRLGYGLSSPLIRNRTIHYMHEYALTELPFLLESLIPNTEFILIGHSDGGSISLIYGAEQNPLLKGIITEAAHVFVESETIQGITQADIAWEKGKLQGLSKYHGDKTEITFKSWSETWLSDWFKFWNIEYLLPSITAPVLAIQGQDDQYGTKEQLDSIALKSAGHSEIKMLEGCAHSPHLEAKEATLALMSDYIGRLIES